MIADVSKVVIEVQDQERAKAFLTERMGFELIQDAPYRKERWLEVRPRGGTCISSWTCARGSRHAERFRITCRPRA